MAEIGTNSEAASFIKETHHTCKLGQWIHEGEGAKHYNHLPRGVTHPPR